MQTAKVDYFDAHFWACPCNRLQLMNIAFDFDCAERMRNGKLITVKEWKNRFKYDWRSWNWWALDDVLIIVWISIHELADGNSNTQHLNRRSMINSNCSAFYWLTTGRATGFEMVFIFFIRRRNIGAQFRSNFDWFETEFEWFVGHHCKSCEWKIKQFIKIFYNFQITKHCDEMRNFGMCCRRKKNEQ